TPRRARSASRRGARRLLPPEGKVAHALGEGGRHGEAVVARGEVAEDARRLVVELLRRVRLARGAEVFRAALERVGLAAPRLGVGGLRVARRAQPLAVVEDLGPRLEPVGGLRNGVFDGAPAAHLGPKGPALDV